MCHSAVMLGDNLHPLIGEHEGHVLAVGLAPLERFYAQSAELSHTTRKP